MDCLKETIDYECMLCLTRAQSILTYCNLLMEVLLETVTRISMWGMQTFAHLDYAHIYVKYF